MSTTAGPAEAPAEVAGVHRPATRLARILRLEGSGAPLTAALADFIDQAQSLNLFIPADVDKWDLMMLHFQAWEKGIKSLYYLRSKSMQRAGFAGGVEADNTADPATFELAAGAGEQTDYEECLSCQ